MLAVMIMLLTKKELELMNVLWESGEPLTSREIIDAAPNRTWHDKSIHLMLKSLIDKGLVAIVGNKPAKTKFSYLIEPILSSEEYAASQSSHLVVDNSAFLVAFLKEKKIDKKHARELLQSVVSYIEDQED